MTSPRKLYWDSSCFICFLNKSEVARRTICEDVLKNAQNGVVEIWTSVWTIAEVIRPKDPPISRPLPSWAADLSSKAPNALPEVQKLWDYFVKQTRPSRQLTPSEISSIAKMFQWSWVKKIQVDERIANDAVSLCRDYGLRPADAVHAASAIVRKCDALQQWDRDFDKVRNLIAVEEPVHLSPQANLPLSPPTI